MVSRRDVQAHVGRCLTMLRDMLLTIPRSLIPMLPADTADEVAAKIRTRIERALSETAKRIEAEDEGST